MAHRSAAAETLQYFLSAAVQNREAPPAKSHPPEGSRKPSRRGIFQKDDFASFDFHNKFWRSAKPAVVIDPRLIHFFDRLRQVTQTCSVNTTKYRLGSAVAARVGSRLHTFQVHRKSIQRQVAHLDSESRRLGKPGLLEGHLAPQRGLNREALATVDAIDDELRVFAIRLPTDLFGDSGVRSPVERSRAVIGIEESRTKSGYRKCGRLAAAGRTSNNSHRGKH
jgi:hypothetical protein